MFAGISASGLRNQNTQSNQGLESIQTPLLAGLQPSDGTTPKVSGGALSTSMSSAIATQSLQEMQNCPELKLAETLAKLSKEPKFLAFYSKVDKPHFNQKLGDFLSGVDTFEAKNTTQGVFDKSYVFNLRGINTNKEFWYRVSYSESGLYEYNPTTKLTQLVDGKITFPNGIVAEYK